MGRDAREPATQRQEEARARYDRRAPMWRVRPHVLSPTLDPLVVIESLRRRGPAVALESALPSRDHGEQTLVAGAPRETFVVEPGAASTGDLRDGDAPTPFHALERRLAAFARELDLSAVEPAPVFGAFGFFAYECGMARSVARLAPWPDAWFLLTDTVVHWPRKGAPPTLWSGDERLARELVDEWSRPNGAHGPREPRESGGSSAPSSPFASSDLGLADYSRAYAAARVALAKGDSYQLCLTYPLVREFAGDPLALHARLRRDNPAPFAAFVHAPFGSIVSCSPERFLRVDRDGHVEARPMKGTAAKPRDAAQRELAARDLVGSAKTRAENLMIADLLRNDLGRVCRLRSVRATRPALLEEHATLLQLVSVVEGELAEGRTRADLLASAFPPGSMTGAPKLRSIELLRALEPQPRGPYAGVLGHLATDGRMDLAVVIRSALVAGGRARVNVGGGVVWESRLEAEHAESRAKGEPLLRALAACGATPLAAANDADARRP
jgi:anthranilate/para-aminobenzoate synthase component I